MDQHHYKFKTRRHGAEETKSDELGRGEAIFFFFFSSGSDYIVIDGKRLNNIKDRVRS